MARKSSAPAKKAPRAPSASQQRDSSGKAEQGPHTPKVARSNRAPATTPSAPVAQTAEQPPRKRKAAGSKPARGTTPPADTQPDSTAGGKFTTQESTSARADVPTCRVYDAHPPLRMLEERFCVEYLKDGNATRAYLAVNPRVKENTAATEAYKLLKKPEIQAAIQSARARIVERMELTSERVLREIARLAFFDPRKLLDEKGNPLPLNELDDDTAAAIAGLEVQQIELGSGENALPAVIKKYKLSDKKGALDMAMRHLGEYEKHNKQLADPLKALLDGMKGSAVPVVANPPAEDDAP